MTETLEWTKFSRHNIKRYRGITSEEYEKLYYAQNGLCAICEHPEKRLSNHGRIKKLAVDHNHETGVIRALLCHDCNVGIGYLKDSPKLLMKAISYLERNEN